MQPLQWERSAKRQMQHFLGSTELYNFHKKHKYICFFQIKYNTLLNTKN